MKPINYRSGRGSRTLTSDQSPFLKDLSLRQKAGSMLWKQTHEQEKNFPIQKIQINFGFIAATTWSGIQNTERGVTPEFGKKAGPDPNIEKAWIPYFDKKSGTEFRKKSDSGWALKDYSSEDWPGQQCRRSPGPWRGRWSTCPRQWWSGCSQTRAPRGSSLQYRNSNQWQPTT